MIELGKVLSAYLFPHPPILINEIGKGEENRAKTTIKGCTELADDIMTKQPETIVVITPHGPLFSDAISISINPRLEGNFKKFGEQSLHFEYQNDLELVNRIIQKSKAESIPIVKIDKNLARNYNISLELDHGTLVPLYFVGKRYNDFKLVHITYGLLSSKELYKFGQKIQESVMESEESTILIASGDLSHKLSNEGPYSYSPYGEEYDRKLIQVLRKGDLKSIVSFDMNLCEKAGECALRSLMILAGFLDGCDIKSDVLSYEGPFGVGYCNARFSILGKGKGGDAFRDLDALKGQRIAKIRESEDEYVRLARTSLEHYIKYNERIKVPVDLNDELMNTRHGAFVTIKKDGALRGCIGTITPVQDNLALEIIENAISAGLRDPRFESVDENELIELIYSVDVLKEPEPISSIKELDVEKYGVIVTKGFRKGLLLPNIDGVDSPAEQVRIALNKAGINQHEGYKLERFEVVRHF